MNYFFKVILILFFCDFTINAMHADIEFSEKDAYKKVEAENAADPIRTFLAQGRIPFSYDNVYGLRANAYDEQNRLAVTLMQILVKEQPKGTNPCAYEALKNLIIASSALNSRDRQWLGGNLELAFLSDGIREELFGSGKCENWRGIVSKWRSKQLGGDVDPEGGENLYEEEIKKLWRKAIKNKGFFSGFNLPSLTIVGSAFELEDVTLGATAFNLQSCKDILALRRKIKDAGGEFTTQQIGAKEEDFGIEVDIYSELSEPIQHAFILNTGEVGNAHWLGVLFYQKYLNEVDFYIFDSLNKVRIGDDNIKRLIKAILNKDLNFTVEPIDRLKNLEGAIEALIQKNDYAAFELNDVYKQLGGTQDFSRRLETM